MNMSRDESFKCNLNGQHSVLTLGSQVPAVPVYREKLKEMILSSVYHRFTVAVPLRSDGL